MCGRFVSPEESAIERIFSLGGPQWRLVLRTDEPFVAKYNVAPTDPMPVVRLRNGSMELAEAHWGLVPHWAKDKKSSYRMINARADTITKKRAYEKPIRQWRCLVPAVGWYEWRTEEDTRQPYYFYSDDGLAFAGIFTWNGSLSLLSCSIITTAANPLAGEIHDRMPAILPAQAWDAWIDPESELEDVLDLLHPYEGNDLRKRKVSRYVNSVKNQGPQCIEAA
jgi:putative SOS response-associated peptidase YedK